MEIFHVPIVSHRDYDVQKSIPDEVTLADEYIRVRGINKIKQSSVETELQKEYSYDYDLIFDRLSISGVCSGYSNDKEAHEVVLDSNGERTLVFVFLHKKEARELHAKLFAWRYPSIHAVEKFPLPPNA